MDRAAGRVGVMGLRPSAEIVQAWVERTCALQGLPAKLDDPRVIEQIVKLVGHARQTGSTRSASNVPRPRIAGRTTARSSTAATIER